jgi:hypothetical protein
MLITESTVSPFVPRLPGSPGTGVVYGPRSTFEGPRDRWLGQLCAWRQGGLIYSAGADLPLTTAQLMAIADSATGG